MAKNETANQPIQQTGNEQELEQLKALLAEKDKQIAEAEAQLQAIAAAEEKKAATAKAGTVRIKLPLEKNGPKDDQQVFINGRQYIIKRGVEVDVPRGVAEILRNREMMQETIAAFDAANAKN